MYKIVTPISHLFKNSEFALDIISNSDFLEGRDHSPILNAEKEIIFHSDLQPIHRLHEIDFDNLVEIKRKRPNLKLVSFHLASCYKAPKLINGIFEASGLKLNRLQMIENARLNILKIKEILGDNIFIAVENNNYLKTEAYDIITDPGFINEIVVTNNIKFLFDIAHAHISAFNLGISFESYIEKLPLNHTIQLHICKCTYDGDMALDSHLCPDNVELKEIQNLLQKLPELKYLTIEYYQDPKLLINALSNFKFIKNDTK